MIGGLHKAFESRVRLGIMAVLTVNDHVEHGTLRDLLEVTDGNLASHIAALVEVKYVQVRKRFVGKRPNTSYKATAAGTRAFTEHLGAMEELLKRDLRR
ncbi:MAG: transcriptional regulator [Bacteroidetes bacterium]|nr:transcriptional regulator [Bacteroidota bacterium]MBX7129338.1 transcriptional regulator [Flavobacteriales bacterium]MCC6654164.1 transcriptional regulator [Flavobacteriales bacterium]HMU14026.1 transcriptional regulator [Flavobacteriales bacterium]HMW97542.1 transcriptional regulator [Flavobacteriales bacterium]